MHCEACGAHANPGAKFCAACGAPVARAAPPPQVPSYPPAPPPPYQQQQQQQLVPHAVPPALIPHQPPGALAQWHGTRGVYCPSCQQRTVPVPYFSRGFNLAKGAALFPFFAIAPLLFFLWRRDRAICSWCKSILPGEMDVPLLDTFTSTPVNMLGALTLAPNSPQDALARSGELVQHEIAVHENRARKNRRRTTFLGVVALGFAGLGSTVAAAEGMEEAAFLFSMTGISGVGAFASNRRGKHHKIAAEAKRQRQRVLEVLALARSHAGKLTVTTVAAHMRLDLKEAETLLDSMVDGRRVDVHVDDAGRMTYVFPEMT
jgi:hypothetical protein